MKLGIGKLPDDAPLFSTLEGTPLRPSNASSNWGEIAESIGMPEITFYARRHTHASQLIASGVDITSDSGTRSRASPLRSMPTCFIPMTARLLCLLMQLGGKVHFCSLVVGAKPLICSRLPG
jgi:hypothetical protein